MPQLTVHNAEIKTATVEIKTLTVSGKQVTLAVFRQLVEAPLVNNDGSFAGLPWGTVNYHPDKCADEYEHRHVVWQTGAELRRSLVKKPRFNRWGCEVGDAFFTSYIHDWLQRKARFFGGKQPLNRRPNGQYDRTIFTDSFVVMEATNEAIDAIHAASYEEAMVKKFIETTNRTDVEEPYKTKWIKDADERAAKALTDLEKKIEILSRQCADYSASTDDLYRRYQMALEVEKERRAQHHARWAEICDLPQLFIAV